MNKEIKSVEISCLRVRREERSCRDRFGCEESTSGLTASGLSQAALDTIVEEVSQRLRYSQGGRSGSIGRRE